LVEDILLTSFHVTLLTKIEPSSSENNSNSSTCGSPQSNNMFSPSLSPNPMINDQRMMPTLNFDSRETRSNTSFVDNNPLFDDLSASFKRLYKKVVEEEHVKQGSPPATYGFLDLT
jgi:hypothetical protein